MVVAAKIKTNQAKAASSPNGNIEKRLICFFKALLQLSGQGVTKAKLPQIVIEADASKQLSCTIARGKIFIEGYSSSLLNQTIGLVDLKTAQQLYALKSPEASYFKCKSYFNIKTQGGFEECFFEFANTYRATMLLCNLYPGCWGLIKTYHQHNLQTKPLDSTNVFDAALRAIAFSIKHPVAMYLKPRAKELFVKTLPSLNAAIHKADDYFLEASELCKSMAKIILRDEGVINGEARQNEGGSKSGDKDSDASEEELSKQNQEAKDSDIQQSQEEHSDIEKIREFFDKIQKGDASGEDAEIVEQDSVRFKKQNLGSFNYKIFTRKFDKTVHIKDMATNKQEEIAIKEAFLKQVQEEVLLQKKHIKKLLNKLRSSNKIRYFFDMESGQLDRKKFTNLLIARNCENVFFKKDEKRTSDIAITILVDNSGSMRGRLIKISSLTCYIIAKTLAKAGVATEVLGFTTSKWHGGDSLNLFELEHQNATADVTTKNNGRVSDVLHIVYKSFSQNAIDKTMLNIALMQKDSLLKENIDGEALEWAFGRIKQREEKRKIIIVISDGTPVDDATLSLNDKDYLKNHLKQVIHKIEKQQDTSLIAIGIMHDVGKFYQNAIRIDSIEELSKTLFTSIEAML